MKRKAISVTEAARNFADCVNRVHYQNLTYVLLRNGAPFARLIPDNEKVCSGRDLAEALKDVELSPEEARAWGLNLRSARKRLKSPRDKWR
jgi:antitoxin (DNA-binding transcriptional repressor) of toxin-antitoxin stability system